MRFLVAATLLALFAEPSVYAARRPLAAPPLRHPAHIGGEELKVTSNGDSFLSVWSTAQRDVVGLRFDTNGAAIDQKPFPVASTWTDDFPAALVWDGLDYVVFVRSGVGTFKVRVSSEGDVRGAGWEEANAHHVAWNGSRYLSVDSKGGTALLTLRDTLLTPLSQRSFRENVYAWENARVVSDGSGFLVVWHEDTSNDTLLVAQRFDAEAQPLGETLILQRFGGVPIGFISTPSLSWNGNSFFVVWRVADELRAARIGADGATPLRITEDRVTSEAAISWDGHVHLIMWHSAPHRKGAFVAADGRVLETFALGTSEYAGTPSIASNSRSFLVLWDGRRAVIDSAASEPVIVREAPPLTTYVGQAEAAIVAGETNVMTAWLENRSIWIARFTHQGVALDPVGIRVADADFFRIASNGRAALIVLRYGGDVRAIRVQHDGLIDPESFDLPIDELPLLASDGSDFRIAWSETVYPGGVIAKSETRTAAIPASGAFTIEPEAPLPAAELSQRPLVLTGGSGSYQLVWQQSLTPYCGFPRCPPPLVEDLLTSLTAQGKTQTTTVVVPSHTTDVGVEDALQTEDQVLLLVRAPDHRYVALYTLDGEPVGSPHVLPLERIRPVLSETRDGYAVFVGSQLIQLDKRGAVIRTSQAVADEGDNPFVTGAVFDGFRTWFVYNADWQPPAPYQEVVRAFIGVIAPRLRAVGR